MKRIILVYIFPLILALSCIFFFHRKIDFLFANDSTPATTDSSFRYLTYFNNNPFYEQQFLKKSNGAATIFLLGSSELSGNTPASPYNFITDHFSTKLKAVGFEGNQCLSIYAQLLANINRLKNAPIVIILSPGWFESKTSKGTSSEVFLKYNSERFLNRILKSDDHSEFNSYLFKRISQLYTEFNSPGLELKLINFKHCASKSYLHKLMYTPLILFDDLCLNLKEKIKPQLNAARNELEVQKILSDSVSFNWDSIYNTSIELCKKLATNNNMNIENSYYSERIHGGFGNIQPVELADNREFEDFKMLAKLLKEKKANVRFIITPLNALYFKDLAPLQPTINGIENEIKIHGFQYLNLFETDTTKYDKYLLRDIAHLSDYGWYKVNQFIINTYHLCK